jgi:hypothetical protein
MLSGTYAIAKLSIFNTAGFAIAASTLAILLWRRVNPVLLISVAGLAYLAVTRW